MDKYKVICSLAAMLLVWCAAGRPAAADDAATCRQAAADDATVAACSRAIRRAPRDATLYNSRGASQYHKGKRDEAIADYTQAIRLNPNFGLAYGNRGVVRDDKGEYDAAIADFGQAIRLDPEHTDWYTPNLGVAYRNRGSTHYENDELDAAIADLDQAIRFGQKDAEVYNLRGASYDHKGARDTAMADYTQAIRLDPNFGLAYINRGSAHYDKGELDAAIADFDRAIRLDSGKADWYAARGNAYSRKGDHGRAIIDYTQAITLSPQFAAAREGRERALAALAAQPEPVKAPAAANPPPSANPPAAADPPASVPLRRVALVIGNSGYRSVPALANPRRDAEAVAASLRQASFQSVELVTDLDRDGMVKALRAFRNQADKADWALVYFAGHGVEINRINYLIPVDAKLVDDRDVKNEALSYEDLLNAVDGARALRLVILDACRVNPFKERMNRTAASRGSLSRGLAPPPETAPGTLVVYSAKEGEVAADDVDGVNSPFARAFVKEVAVPGREVRRLFDFVRDDVLRDTGSRQQPWTYGSLPAEKDFFFLSAK